MKLPQHKDSLEPKIFHWKPFSMLWGYRTRRLIKSSIKLVYQWRSIEYSVLLATKRTWVQFPAAASSFKQKYDKSKQIMVDSIIVIIMSLACKLSCESPPPPPLTLLSNNQNVNLKGHDRIQSRGAFNKVGGHRTSFRVAFSKNKSFRQLGLVNQRSITERLTGVLFHKTLTL